MIMFVKNKEWQKIGQIVAGFGILFMGMMFMSESMEGLREWEPFIDILSPFESPAIGTTGRNGNHRDYAGKRRNNGDAAGAGLDGPHFSRQFHVCDTRTQHRHMYYGHTGRCMKANKTAKRTAVVHVLFNVIGTLIFVVLLNVLPIKEWIYSLSPGQCGETAG